MAFVHIAELNPELAARDSKQFKAAVTLIWPYSSSQRQFALLLAEPDFRLRRKKGQVRARFSGSSAKALATTGVGIGDEVVLSLRGAQFLQEGTVSTPGRSIDWELEYTQTVVVHVLRDGSEIAHLELLEAAPTPAPQSPVRREAVADPSSAQQWSSPAFLKRARLSDGPFFEAPYDPLADENAEGHDKKRRRKSYRDWKAWTYSARTPSPEKGDAGMDDDLARFDASPSRPTQLPNTPVSPPQPDSMSVAAGPLRQREDAYADEKAYEQVSNELANAIEDGNAGTPANKPQMDDFVRDEEYYDLYAGPDEHPPEDSQFAFGGDTEANTEEEDSLEQTDGASPSATEVNTEDLEEDRSYVEELRSAGPETIASGEVSLQPDTSIATDDDSLIGARDVRDETDHRATDDINVSTRAAKTESLKTAKDTPTIVMPPPTLPALDTSFFAPINTSCLLTPIGREPASPTLEPLDSALLPLPSPFPGERDSNTTSYLDHVSADQEPAEMVTVDEQVPPSDANYIEENSFFSSIGSSKNPAMHPDHESAFTPVRFAFGMDGAGFSRPLELSSPAPEEVPKRNERQSGEALSFAQDGAVSHPMPAASSTKAQLPIVGDIAMDEVSEVDRPEREQVIPEVIELSSDSASELSEETEAHDQPVARELTSVDEELHVQTEDIEQALSSARSPHTSRDIPDDVDAVAVSQVPVGQEDGKPSTNQSGRVSEFVDLGSPPESSDVDELAAESEDKPAGEDGNEHIISEVDHSIPDRHLAQQDDITTVPSDPGSHSEFTNMNYAPLLSNLIANTQESTATYTRTQQEIEHLLVTGDNNSPFLLDDAEPFTAMQDSDMHILDNSQGESHDISQWIPEDMEDLHPDIKMESVEDGSVFQVAEHDTQAGHGTSTNTAMASLDKLLIHVPEDGDKVGELHTIAVPTTGPARNTRSKTKASASPTKEAHVVSKRTTRSTRSKASTTPVGRTMLSPHRTRTRSTMSPSQDATQTSPDSLPSQSRLLSPTNSTSIATAATYRSSRKHASQRSVVSVSDAGATHLGSNDPFKTSFEPSQELNASQGRYSNVSFVKDSEEESLHSENSLSTVKYSDDWNMFTNFSDPVIPNEQDIDMANLKPPAATAPEQGSWLGPKTKWTKSEPQVVAQTNSSPTQPSSPNQKLRSTDFREAVSSSPRVTRTTRRQVYKISSSPPVSTDEGQEETTPKAGQGVVYPALPGESENHNIRSSSPVPFDLDELMHSSPPAVTRTFPSVDQQSLMDSNNPMIPEATQQTKMESQHSVEAENHLQTLPMTPQLTQATSASRQSFSTSMQYGIESSIDRSPTVLTKSTPRRNATEVDVASPSSSPKEHSPDDSDLEAPKAHSPDLSSDSIDTKPEPPSIGLSTPLAYYTPLNSLTYFLNRSSQFHTASNPDVLALVTSGTTSAQRATKGRKDWTTSLHITDVSSYPATTTVNLFRAYQTALPVAETGDVILLRAFAVKSLNRHPTLTSADESSWCVWRYKKPVWGAKRIPFGEVQAREEVRGPVVERGEGEWKEVERLRNWFLDGIKRELEGAEDKKRHTRSQDKGNVEVGGEGSQRVTRSKDVATNGDDEA